MKYLTNTTEVFRADTEAEAQALIDEAKASNQWVLARYSSAFKERKKSGEVIDSFYLVTLVKSFNDPKEPEVEVTITYEV